MRQGISAKLYGFGVAATCLAMAASCTPYSDSSVTGPSGCAALIALRSSGVPPATQQPSKKRLLEYLSNTSGIPTAEQDERLFLRRAIALTLIRAKEYDHDVIDQDLADVRDSLVRIPGLLDAVRHGEDLQRIARERIAARRKTKGAHVAFWAHLVTQADDADYVAAFDVIGDIASDTAATPDSVYIAVSATKPDIIAPFSGDTEFSTFTDKSAEMLTDTRDRMQAAALDAWSDGWDGQPVWLLASSDCHTATTIPSHPAHTEECRACAAVGTSAAKGAVGGAITYFVTVGKGAATIGGLASGVGTGIAVGLAVDGLWEAGTIAYHGYDRMLQGASMELTAWVLANSIQWGH